MMQHPAPQTPSAAQWEAVLTFRELPILAETRNALRQELRDPQVSFDTLVPIAERDPALCWHLLQAATTQNPDCREQLTGAYSCLSLLGMQELVRLVKQLPVIDRKADDKGSKLYRQALYTAHMAGCLAAQWASAKGLPTGMAHWSAMLAHSVLWPWLLLEESSHNWLYYLSEGDDIATATEKVFGTEPRNWQRLVRRHNLPEPAAAIFAGTTLPDKNEWKKLRRHDPRDLDSGRRLIHTSQSPSMLALTAAGAAWHLHMNPEGKHSRRWLELSSHAQGRKLNSLIGECRTVQVREASLRQSALASGIGLLASPEPVSISYPKWRPAPVKANQENANQELAEQAKPVNVQTAQAEAQQSATEKIRIAELTEKPITVERTSSGLPEDHAEEASTSENTTSEIATATANTADHGRAYLNKLMNQLNDSPNSFGDWHYLMQGVLKGIRFGIGIEHGCVLLPDKQRKSMRMVYGEQTEGLGDLSVARIPLESAPLFRQLMKKRAAVHINATNRDAYFKGMPTALIQALPDELVLMSITAGQNPIGIVVAAPKQREMINDDQYKRFRQLCTTTSNSLVSLRKLSVQRQAQKRHAP